MSARVAVGWLAGLLLAVGVLLGSSSHSVAGYDCGSAFSPVDAGPIAAASCSDALAGPRVGAFTLSGVGALALLFLGLTGMQRGRVAPAREVEQDAA